MPLGQASQVSCVDDRTNQAGDLAGMGPARGYPFRRAERGYAAPKRGATAESPEEGGERLHATIGRGC